MSQQRSWQALWNSIAVRHPSDSVRASGRSPDRSDIRNDCRRIERFLDLSRGDKVLDVCCGNGIIARELAPFTLSWFGCDFSPEMLAAASRNRIANARFLIGVSTRLPFRDRSFSKVMLNACLQHHTTEAAITAVSEARRVCAPGGRIFVGDIPDRAQKRTFDRDTGFGCYRQLVSLGSQAKRFVSSQPRVNDTWFNRGWVLKFLGDAHWGVTIHGRDSPYRFDILLTWR